MNLAFSLQAAYAAPLILLAQTRQADRGKAIADADARHREELARNNLDLLQKNTDLTEQIAQLTRRIDEPRARFTSGCADRLLIPPNVDAPDCHRVGG